MKEHKYRVYDKFLKKYIEDCYVDQDGTVCKDIYYESYENGYIENLIIEDFVGLKDIDGIEIYAGDVVQDKYKAKLTVTWDDEKIGYTPFSRGDGCGCCAAYSYGSDTEFYEIKVIGNVHDVEDKL